MSTFHEISECIGFLRVLQSGCFTCLSQDASSLSSSNIWTQGFEGKRDRRRMGFREFVVPEILQEICWNRRTLHGPVLRHILHQFYLHFLTYAPWYGMAPKSSNKRFWQDGVSLLLLSLITSTLRWRSQDGRWTSRVDFWRPTSWQVVWKNSLLHIQETVEVQHVITCWHVREAQHVTNRIRPPPKPIMWDLFACSLCHVYIYTGFFVQAFWANGLWYVKMRPGSTVELEAQTTFKPWMFGSFGGCDHLCTFEFPWFLF